MTRQGRLQLWTFGADEAALLDRVGLSGRIPDVRPGQDFLAVLSNNTNPNKIDAYLERSVRHDVVWDVDGAQLSATTTIDLHNRARVDDLPEVVVGNDHDNPVGSNRTNLSVLSPLTVSELRVDGEVVPYGRRREFGLWRYTITAVVPAGEHVEVQLDSVGAAAGGRTYELIISPQPMVRPDELSVNIRTRGGEELRGPTGRFDGDSAVLAPAVVEDTLVAITASD